MNITEISLGDLLTKENIEIPQKILDESKVVIIPKEIGGVDHINSHLIPFIKRIQVELNPVTIASRDEKYDFYDFRGGEYEFPLIIVEHVVAPIVIGLITSWIHSKIKEYNTQKEDDPQNPLVKEPSVKVKIFIKDDSKYLEVEGPASEVVEEIVEEFLES